jgi:undecaprenyl-diphosphatase
MTDQLIYGIVLGIVQGIAEFLPISSKGHLVILQQPLEQWLHFDMSDRDRLQFDVVLHFGTLVSLLIVYRWQLLQLRVRDWALIVLATVPVGALGLLLHDEVESLFGSPLLTGVCLLGTAALLFVADRGRGTLRIEDLTAGRALCIGLFQAGALLPGISRSGTTITAGTLVGLQRDAAARFSFFLAIPAIAGACVVTLAKFAHHPVLNVSVPALVAGATVSMIVGVASLEWLIRMIARGRLHWFAWYCIAFSLLTIGWQLALRVGMLPGSASVR